MVPRTVDDRTTTITINCAGKCQRVALGAAGILLTLIGVPLVLAVIVLWGYTLHHFFAWLLHSTSPYDAGPDLAAVFGTIFTIVGVVGSIVAACCMELRK